MEMQHISMYIITFRLKFYFDKMQLRFCIIDLNYFN